MARSVTVSIRFFCRRFLTIENGECLQQKAANACSVNRFGSVQFRTLMGKNPIALRDSMRSMDQGQTILTACSLTTVLIAAGTDTTAVGSMVGVNPPRAAAQLEDTSDHRFHSCVAL